MNADPLHLSRPIQSLVVYETTQSVIISPCFGATQLGVVLVVLEVPLSDAILPIIATLDLAGITSQAR